MELVLERVADGLELLTPVASAGMRQLRPAGFELDENYREVRQKPEPRQTETVVPP